MKILVVEDEHRIASSIKKGLEQEHHTVDTAFDGTTGYDLASSENYDLILLDLMLPGLDGLTICKKLRAQNIHTPILMLTARGQTQDKVTGLDSGADDYLSKPFSFEELLARVRALSRRPKKSISRVLSLPPLTLDPDTYQVTFNNNPISLTGKEFSLLEFFMRHPNQILTKDSIISHVWTYESDILPNTIEVYIKNLRRKLSPEIIKTVRGFGYKIHV